MLILCKRETSHEHELLLTCSYIVTGCWVVVYFQIEYYIIAADVLVVMLQVVCGLQNYKHFQHDLHRCPG